ncbi:hypothetical protein OWV82_022021 [Melia azedarach]|uniref:Uncharacterized protein n=2 Tax=Melia azedarach TaxID=155640 RepID=A0ACC1X1J9_MELAZ|nr:hypothetical protein OWV82_022021 [Melia azedarach]KAJ4705214.1 hypothetical protein OWV82_022021 [Melia azedarach]
MEENEFITIASIEEHEGWLLDINENLEPQRECCIYKVPKLIRKIREDAYTPQVISIGPLHHGEKELVDMEKQKVRLKKEFLKRIVPEIWQDLITFIEMQAQYIRNCYEDMPKFQKLEFVRMILYDAIFIIELFLRFYEGKSDYMLKRVWGIAIYIDLQLLENQLPYFILNGLYMLAFPKPNLQGQNYPSFFVLSYEFLSDYMFNELPDEVEIKHFVDLRRYALTKTYSVSLEIESLRELPCTLKLQESGVKFKGIEGQGLLDIKFEKKNRRIPWLQVHKELQIPRLQVYDETECLIRNVMALEQCHYPSETHVCNYIDIMDNLINTEDDVNLLVEAGIISNYMGDNAKVAKMFNELGQKINVSPSCYEEIIKDLNVHHNNPWNHAMATLKRVYFSNYWRGTATIAAIMLLFLTFIQTVCSILQVV